MQSPDNISLSSAGGAGGPGYHRVRLQPGDVINAVEGGETAENEKQGIKGVNDDEEDDEDDLEMHLSPSSTADSGSWVDDLPRVVTGKSSKKADGYQKVNNQDQPAPQPQQHNQLHSTQPQKKNNRSRSNSWEMETGGNLFDDEDEEEDAQVVRRYAYRNRIPIVPAEFSHQPLPRRLWQSFVELRTAARQRRAARLLNNSQYTATSHCILTWCCDATDRGIALVAILILLWLIVGWTYHVSRGYWLLGVMLFAIRVTARTTYESLTTRAKRGGGNHGGRPQGNSNSPSRTSSPTPVMVPSLEMTKDYRDSA
ncbi:hypothetical protein ACA910_007883 [Epithemia clementina (nom. ined.)]